MIDDIFDFNHDKPGGTAGSVANGCAKLLVIGVIAYGVMMLASALLLLTMFGSVPGVGGVHHRTDGDGQTEIGPLQSVRVTTEVNLHH